MNIWLIKSGEPIPTNNNKTRLLRMGMIAEELKNRKHNILWFTSTFDHFKKVQLYNSDKIVKIEDNYFVYFIHALKYKKNISFTRIINHKMVSKKFLRIAKNMEKPDLIYAAFPTIDLAEQAVRYGEINKIPVIIDIRDLWPDIFEQNLHFALKLIAKPYIRYLNYKTEKIMKKAFAINSISSGMLNWGITKGKRKNNKNDRAFYIGYKKDITSNNKKIDIIDENKFNISFFSTINNQFDYNKILDISEILWEKDKDIIINICGIGPKFEYLHEKVKNLKSKNVKLLGWQEKENLTHILANSKVGLAPYKNTFDFQMSVSNKFCEYIAYGLPIVITSEGNMKNIIEKNNCGIASLNSKEICDFILKLKNDEKFYNTIAQNAIDLYEKEFKAEKIYSELVDYLESILKEKKK